MYEKPKIINNNQKKIYYDYVLFSSSYFSFKQIKQKGSNIWCVSLNLLIKVGSTQNQQQKIIKITI